MAEALETRLRALQQLQRRCEERRVAMRQRQISIMMERNFFLSKVREIEEYGRAHHWGKPLGHGDAPGEPGDHGDHEEAEDGAPLLKAIAAVLYDSRSNPATPRAQ